jgi:hypothetical protein
MTFRILLNVNQFCLLPLVNTAGGDVTVKINYLILTAQMLVNCIAFAAVYY